MLRRQVVSSAASLVGWGAIHEGKGISGQWHGPWLMWHINVLELQTVYLALQHFLPLLRNQHVLVRTDSTVAAAYVNRQGGLGSPCLCILAQMIWEWAYSWFKFLRAMYVVGPANLTTDQFPREGQLPREWRLHPEVVGEIWVRFGTAVVDLFTSRETMHCPLLFSIGRDNPPLGTNVMAHQWPQGLLYAFPTFTLLHPLLQRVQVEEVSLILLGSYLASDYLLLGNLCVFYALDCALLQDCPWELHIQRDLLSQAHGSLFHPFPQGLRLWGMAPERAKLLAMVLPQSVVSTLQGAQSPSTQAAYAYR